MSFDSIIPFIRKYILLRITFFMIKRLLTIVFILHTVDVLFMVANSDFVEKKL